MSDQEKIIIGARQTFLQSASNENFCKNLRLFIYFSFRIDIFSRPPAKLFDFHIFHSHYFREIKFTSHSLPFFIFFFIPHRNFSHQKVSILFSAPKLPAFLHFTLKFSALLQSFSLVISFTSSSLRVRKSMPFLAVSVTFFYSYDITSSIGNNKKVSFFID